MNRECAGHIHPLQTLRHRSRAQRARCAQAGSASPSLCGILLQEENAANASKESHRQEIQPEEAREEEQVGSTCSYLVRGLRQSKCRAYGYAASIASIHEISSGLFCSLVLQAPQSTSCPAIDGSAGGFSYIKQVFVPDL